MYHHHSHHSNGPRPHHQPHPNQNQNQNPSDMMTQMGFQFPRPTQLPDELESALAIRGARDMDHRLIDHMNPSSQHHSQGSGPGISQHGTYGSAPLTSENQSGHHQGVDWSNYQAPSKLFATPPPGSSQQPSRHQGPQQQPGGSHSGSSISSWSANVSDSPSPQGQHRQGVRSGGGGGDGHVLYTPESAGSILASFGLSNEDLEVLSHYPDDQLTPDTLPLILRDIQINKSGKPKPVASSSSSQFSRSIHDMPLPPRSSPVAHSRSPDVPSLLTVTQTAGKVIDYGHASRAKDESSTRETFKREQLSNERTVKMYPKVDKTERRQVHLEQTESSKHGDRDYRRASTEQHKISRSPVRELPPSSKSRNLDRDYRHNGPKPRPSSETRSDDSSRRSVSSSSGTKPHGNGSKKLPTPTMIGDFSAVSPKVYPHTCSLCHIQCDQEKDWLDHINTVKHTAACRDLRNKYPSWKPNTPRHSEQYGGQVHRDPKHPSPSHSVSRSLSGSPGPSPPHGKRRVGPQAPGPHGKPFSPHRQPRYHQYSDHQLEHQNPRRPSSFSREHRAERRDRESSGFSFRSGLKRPHGHSAKFFSDTSERPLSFKADDHSKPLKSYSKRGPMGWFKVNKSANTRASDAPAKPSPAKKKKKAATPTSQDSIGDRLVYLTGIPKDATEQEVTDLVSSFGTINNVILMPCSEEESEKPEGQKASVCMVKAEDAQALANSTNLSIREQQITASTAKKPEGGQSSDASKPATGQKMAAAGVEADQKSSVEKGLVLITGLPESGWSESDIVLLMEPFGTPFDIIVTSQIGKALVSVSDVDVAEAMVKGNTSTPAKVKDSELEMIHVKQHIGLNTPVALYNLLMGSSDTAESSDKVSWSSLLVIRNVPNSPSCSSEVQKLVRRFGTVIKTLVLNNMVICEMATGTMALSVYKRFHMFPCIIQNNPLFFSRKPDPKTITQTKVVSAHLDTPQATPANGKGSHTATAADEEQTQTLEEKPECPAEVLEKDPVETVESQEEKIAGGEETVEGNGCADEIQKDEVATAASDSSAEPDTKPEEVMDTNQSEMSAVEAAVDNEEEKVDVSVPEAGKDNKEVCAPETGEENPPAGEETDLPSSDGIAAPQDSAVPEMPKVTQAMVNALLVECRTRLPQQADDTTAPTCGVKDETQPKEEQSDEKAAPTETKTCTEEEEKKKQERERKEKDLRRAKQRKERERRPWDREDRSRRERESDDRGRRDRERRERERRGRKRGHEDVSRSSSRSEGFRQSSHREERYSNSEEESRMVDEEAEFPFNLSDFVTVDEVGDVADLPGSPSEVVPMETTEGEEAAATSVQQETAQDTPMEVSTETSVTVAMVTPVEESESAAECSDSSAPSQLPPEDVIATDDVFAAAVSSDSAAARDNSPPTQTEAPDSETTLTTESQQPPVPASAASANPLDSSDPSWTGPAAVTAHGDEEEEEEEKKEEEESAVSVSQTLEDRVVVESKKTQEEEKMNKETEDASVEAESGKHENSTHTTHTQEKSEKKTIQAIISDSSLPPFDPKNPVGLEFLVPKTGFFCKPCNRFFSGSKEAEISHCKTIKHYDNLKKYLETMKTTTTVKVSVKQTDSS
ncbi:hypothetical protein JOB18_022373 [Solea senegalensis]|nr:zinc finger protein 638-like [Solea senegalensis]KAG7485982.1 zinc finger protein 638-like isoform X1 [Solea senegalensis]KAG7485983.1 hypothetical protein JOB18_022373 [Solea senegalensis]